MIDRSHRFHGHSSLQYLYTRGKFVRSTSLSLRYCLNTKRTTYRVAVVVSRKVNKSAVVRNRIRRRIYEIVRERAGELNGVYDIAILVYDDNIATISHEKVKQEIGTLYKKAHIINASLVSHAIVDTKE